MVAVARTSTMLHFTAHSNYKGTPSSDIRCFKGIVVTSFTVTPKVTVLKQSNTIALTNVVLTPPSLHTKKPIVSALRLLHIRLQQYRAGKVQIFEVAKVPTINPKRSCTSIFVICYHPSRFLAVLISGPSHAILPHAGVTTLGIRVPKLIDTRATVSCASFEIRVGNYYHQSVQIGEATHRTQGS